nr:GNAT family N-acetyltransferase [Lachnospiraceae bacterium]
MHKCLEIEGGQLHISDEPDLLLALFSHGAKCVPILNEKTRELDMTCFPFVVEDEEQVSLADYTKMYHRLCGIPETVMITERLRIREITTDDLPALFRLYDDPDVTAYIEPLFPYEEEREYTE